MADENPNQPPSERDLIEDALLEAERAGRTADLPPVDSFKGYEILGEIHRGGQGVVYQALQIATKRRVALKVLHNGPFTGSAGRTRFEREVQVLGQLSHPHIVKIHDSGITENGSCFYVMDYISGSTLEEFIGRDPKPDVRTTLALFAKICDAIGYAHLRGIIHRDLKPSNIRVDRSGEPIVVDFGLAKVALGDVGSGPDQPRMMTVTGEFIGSLPWASPEQAEGSAAAIDVRTDVYSLGVILYQLLTGRFPYTVIGNMRDVLENILRAEPAKPSTVRRQVNDEVETIVMKCLAKDRDRRYQSGAELGRDVKRYLAGEPIEAKRDSVSYMLRKAVRKHKAAASVIAVGLVGVVVFGVSMWLAWREASAQRARAEANLAEIRSIARTMIVDINDQIDDLRGATPARQALLTKAEELFQKMVEQASPDDLDVWRELADVSIRVAEIHAGLYEPQVGGVTEADGNLDDATRMIQELTARDPGHPGTIELEARLHVALAGMHQQRREFKEAADDFDLGVKAYDQVLAGGRVADPVALGHLRDERMAAMTRRADLLAQVPVASDAEAAALDAEAAAIYDQAERYWQQRADASPADLEASQQLYILLDKRARASVATAMAMTRGEPTPEQLAAACDVLADARPLAERAGEGFERLLALRPQSADLQRDLYLAHYFIGRTMLDEARLRGQIPEGESGRLDQSGLDALLAGALEHAQRGLHITEGIFASDESNLLAQRDVALSLNQVGNAFREMGQYEEAVLTFERGLGVRRDIARADPSPRHRSDLGVGLFKRAEAEELAARSTVAAERRLRLQAAERLAVECVGVFQGLVQEGRLTPESPEISDSKRVLELIRAGLTETRRAT